MKTPELKHPWVALITLCLGMLVASLDTTIVNVTLPSLVGSLHADLDQVLWVLNAYVLVYATLLISGGRLGDVLSARRVMLAGLVLFTVASALCGLSHTAGELIGARILQGVGGAMMVPQVLTLISVIFPAERRGAAFGVMSATTGVAAVSGPVLGGLIVTNWSWRWVFYINVPVCTAAFVLALLFIPDIRSERSHRFDPVGIILATAGLGAVTYGLLEGQRYDWGTLTGFITVPAVIGAGVVALIAFVVWESRASEPLVPLELFRYRSFSIATSLSAVSYLTMYGVTLIVTLHLQSVLGLSALRTGLTYVPMAFAMGFLSVLAGRLTDRLGGRYLLFGGLVVLAAGITFMALVESGTASAARFLAPLFVVGVGIGFVMAPTATEAMRDLPRRLAGTASGVFTSSRQVTGAIGIAVVGAVLQTGLTDEVRHAATRLSGQLPPAERARFVEGLARTTGHGGVAARPASHSDLAQRLAHDAYASAFAVAERPALAVLVALALASAAGALLLKRAPAPQPDLRPAPEPQPQQESA